MILSRITYSGATVAAALLDSFKAWARIDHDDDDAQLTLVLRRAMAALERQLGISIATATWEFVPYTDTLVDTLPVIVPHWCGCDPIGNRPTSMVTIPLVGVRSFTATDVDNVDVTADFVLVMPSLDDVLGPARLRAKVGNIPADTRFVVTVGSEDDDDMPPEVTDVLYRFALYLWESRESAAERSMTEVPDWATRAFGSLWVPRV